MPRPVLEIKEPYTPELLSAVTSHIEGLLATVDNPKVFEFGGGFSTVWFAGLAKKVVSAEHDSGWYKETEKALKNAGLSGKAELIQVTENNQAAAIDGKGMFDLVLVDGWDFQRESGALKAMKHVKPGGWLVIDDSHWPILQAVQAEVRAAGWTEAVFSGNHTRKDNDTRYHQTIIFQRPAAEEHPVKVWKKETDAKEEPKPEPEKTVVAKVAAPKPVTKPKKAVKKA